MLNYKKLFFTLILFVMLLSFTCCKQQVPITSETFLVETGFLLGNGEILTEASVDTNEVDYGGSATFSIEVNSSSSEFKGWYTNPAGTDTPESLQETFIKTNIISNIKLYPKVERKMYMLRIETNIANLRVPSTFIGVYHGIPTQISIQPAEGYDFINWSTDSVSVIFDDNTIMNPKVTVTGQGAIIYANFNMKEFDLYSAIASDSDVSGIINPEESTPNGSYKYNTKIILKASTLPNTMFIGWFDANIDGNIISPSNPYIFNITKDTNLYAKFTPKVSYQLNVTYNGSGSGTVNLNPQPPYFIEEPAKTVTLTIIPDSNSLFSGWTNDTGLTEITPNQEYRVLMNQDRSYEANFIRIYNLAVGNLIGNGNLNKQPSVDKNTVAHGGNAVFSIEVDTVSTIFKGWFDNMEGTGVAVSLDETYIVDNITSDITLYPKAVLKQYILNVSANTGGTTNPSGNIIVNHGETTPISAMANANYVFRKWNLSGSGISIDNNTIANANVNLVSGNASVVATFLDTSAIIHRWRIDKVKYVPAYEHILIDVANAYSEAEKALRITLNSNNTFSIEIEFTAGIYRNYLTGNYAYSNSEITLNANKILHDLFHTGPENLGTGDPEEITFTYSVDNNYMAFGAFVGGNETNLTGNWYAKWDVRKYNQTVHNLKEFFLTLNPDNTYTYRIINTNYSGTTGIALDEAGIWSKNATLLTLDPDNGDPTAYNYIIIGDGLLFSTNLKYFNIN